ncbi:MAG: phage antirepressor N-terminal domain-containing protein [Magnetococcales bacterium]|nr:phage antirepressor N-terminal domain-containing protein [Magnetococcales bacterium]
MNATDTPDPDNTSLIPVPFRDATLYLVEHNGEAYTPMKPIIEGMGLSWSAQLIKLKEHKIRWGIAEIAIPSIGCNQTAICMPLRKLPAYLSGINANKVAPANQPAVIAFQEECDKALWSYWDKGRAIRTTLPGQDAELWRQLRREGKYIRRLQTDRIKDFIEYAKVQGSKNANKYY